MPSFHEYIECGGAEIGSYATIAWFYCGLGDIGKEEDFKWLRSRPKLVHSLASKTLLMDDIIDFEVQLGLLNSLILHTKTWD